MPACCSTCIVPHLTPDGQHICPACRKSIHALCGEHLEDNPLGSDIICFDCCKEKPKPIDVLFDTSTYNVTARSPFGSSGKCSYSKRGYTCVFARNKKSSCETISNEDESTGVSCAAEGCTSLSHVSCYLNFFSKNDALGHNCHFFDDDNILQVVCGKNCYKKLKSKLNLSSNAKSRGSYWHNDGSPSSLAILLDWLTTEKNYTRYRGASDSQNPREQGMTKEMICQEISDLIRESGIISDRSRHAVKSKIIEIEKDFRTAHDWINATGSGVEKDEHFEEAVKKRCAYYYQLKDVFLERASAYADYTNERNFDYSYDDISESNFEEVFGRDTDSQTSLTTAPASITTESQSSATPDLRRTPKRNNCLSTPASHTPIKPISSFAEASVKTKKLLRLSSSGSQTSSRDSLFDGMKDLYNLRLQLDKQKMEIDERNSSMSNAREEKRAKLEENRCLVQAYSDVVKVNADVLKMRYDALTKSNGRLSQEDVDKMFPLVDYPPKPIW